MAQRGTPLKAFLVRQILELVPILGKRATARRLNLHVQTVRKYVRGASPLRRAA